jgi:hypothetical protein
MGALGDISPVLEIVETGDKLTVEMGANLPGDGGEARRDILDSRQGSFYLGFFFK